MSSTEDGRAAARFFHEFLMPLADRNRSRKDAFLAPPDVVRRDSLFVLPRRSRMVREDFELSGGSSPEALVKDIVALWRSEGVVLPTEVESLEKALLDVAAAEAARHSAEAKDTDLSPYVYAMY